MNALKKTILLTTLLALITLPTATSLVSIQNTKIPPRQIKGGVIPIYTTILTNGTGGIRASITIISPSKTISQQKLINTIGNEYTANYFDTKQNGTYHYSINVEKGKERDTKKGTFTITDLKINKVDFVETVKKVQSVNKLTNQTTLQVFGTEYEVADEARMYLQLLEGGNPVTNATCFANIYYPNETAFFKNAPMMQLPLDKSVYKFDVTIPNQTGIYILVAECFYQTTKKTKTATNADIIIGTINKNALQDTFTIDGKDFEISDVGSSVDTNFTFNASGINLTKTKDMNINFFGKIHMKDEENGATLFVHIYNFETQIWEQQINTITGGGADKNLGNAIQNATPYVNNDDLVYVRLQALETTGEIKDLHIDFLSVDFQQLQAQNMNTIRGGGEFHVTLRQFGLFPLIWQKIQDVWTFMTSDLWQVTTQTNNTVNKIENDTKQIIKKIDEIKQKQTQAELMREYKAKRVSGTEYVQGDTAIILVQVLKQGVPENNAQCKINIFSPNSTTPSNYTQTIFEQNMTYVTNSDGTYQYEFKKTSTKGLYFANTLCKDEIEGAILSGFKNNITAITTNETPQQISQAQLKINTQLPNSTIFAMAAIQATATTSSGKAHYEIKLPGNKAMATRTIVLNQPGNMLLFAKANNLPINNYTINFTHNTTTGTTLNTKMNVFAMGLQDDKNPIISCDASIQNNRTTSSDTLTNMQGMNCNLTLTRTAKALALIRLTGISQNAGQSVSYTISVDGTPESESERTFLNAGDSGSMAGVFFVENLLPGQHQFDLQWSVDTGTIIAEDIEMQIITTQAGQRTFPISGSFIEKSKTKSEQKTNNGLSNSITTTIGSPIIGIMTLQSKQKKPSKSGFYSISIDNTAGNDFERHFPTQDKDGSIAVIHTINTTIGTHFINGQWFTESQDSELTGKTMSLISFGLSTTPDFIPSYLSLDFHVNQPPQNLSNTFEELAMLTIN